MQKAGELVEKAQQTSQEQRDALDKFKDILVKKDLLAHKDKVTLGRLNSLQAVALLSQGRT